MNIDTFKFTVKHNLGMKVKDCKSDITLKFKKDDNM